MRNFSDSAFIIGLSGLANVWRTRSARDARRGVRLRQLHAARVVDQDADDVLLRDRRLDDEHRAEDAEEDDGRARPRAAPPSTARSRHWTRVAQHAVADERDRQRRRCTTAAATGAPAGGAKRKSPWRKTWGRYSKRNWNSVSNTGALRADSILLRRRGGEIGPPSPGVTTVSSSSLRPTGRRGLRRGRPAAWPHFRHKAGARSEQPDRQRRIDLPESAHGRADRRRDGDHRRLAGPGRRECRGDPAGWSR